MRKEKIKHHPGNVPTEKTLTSDKEVKDWKKETDPVKRALKQPLLWFYTSETKFAV